MENIIMKFRKNNNIAKINNAEVAQEAVSGNMENVVTDAENETQAERKPFQVWTVGGESYRMKLGTAEISELEQKFKTNLMNVMGAGNGGMPALTVMLDVAHAAMKKYHHGMKRADMNALFDQYIEEGGSQLNFYTEIYMGIFGVSGFFSSNLTTQMNEALENAKDRM